MLWLTKKTVRPSPVATSRILPEAFLLECIVADGQHLVDDQDLRLQVRGDGEGQPHVHPRGVALHRRVEELLDLGEGDDLVELAVDLHLPHAQDGAVEIDILPAGKLRMETRPHLEQRGDSSSQPDDALGRLRDPAEDLEQGRFARTVAADEPDDLPPLDVEGDVPQGPERRGLGPEILRAPAEEPLRGANKHRSIHCET